MPLGVGHEAARVHLHDVGLDVAARLARARAADDEHVAVAVVFPRMPRARHRHAVVLGEDDVVGRVAAVHEGVGKAGRFELGRYRGLDALALGQFLELGHVELRPFGPRGILRLGLRADAGSCVPERLGQPACGVAHGLASGVLPDPHHPIVELLARLVAEIARHGLAPPSAGTVCPTRVPAKRKWGGMPHRSPLPSPPPCVTGGWRAPLPFGRGAQAETAGGEPAACRAGRWEGAPLHLDRRRGGSGRPAAFTFCGAVLV